MKSDAVSSSQGAIGPEIGPLNDIHNENNYGNIDNFENSSIQSVKSSLSNGVMPLQYYTNEYQVSHSGLYEATNVGMFAHDFGSFLPAETCSDTNLWNLKDIRGKHIFCLYCHFFYSFFFSQLELFSLCCGGASCQMRILMVVLCYLLCAFIVTQLTGIANILFLTTVIAQLMALSVMEE